MTDIQRFQKIVAAWKTALDGGDANSVEIFDLLPAIYDLVPDTNTEEIIEALTWGSDRELKKAQALLAWEAARSATA